MIIKNKSVLVTGGAGYIGVHTVLELCRSGFKVIVVDNLSNSSKKNILKLKKIYRKQILFFQIDLTHIEKIRYVFSKFKNIELVIHFAALKSVPESITKPIKYYNNNISATLNLLSVMGEFKCKKLIFSSSASVYASNSRLPFKESNKTMFTNPYSHSKLFIEEILKSLVDHDRTWKICILRYFNPAGADTKSTIGEENLTQTNLFPEIIRVITKQNKYLRVFGDDYNTPDGSAIRDYIHVTDVALGHISAIKYLNKKGYSIFNLGSGSGYSVFRVISTFEKIIDYQLPIKIDKKRPGDSAKSYADISLSKKNLRWSPTRTLEDMCMDSLKWMKINF